MELKKNPKIDLNKKRSLFLAAGYVVATAFTLAAFEWKTFYEMPVGPPTYDIGDEIDIEDIIENTYRKPDEPKKTIPTKKKPAPVIDLSLKPTNEEVKEELTIESLEIDESKMLLAEGGSFEEEDVVDEIPFVPFPQKQAEYPGGNIQLLKFLQDNADYPRIAIDNGIEGVVYISYIVEVDGSVSNVEVKRSVHPLLDRAAVAAVKKVSGYKPGMQGNRPVRVPVIVPIRFELRP